VAGIPELVHPGEHGWLVPAGDVEALASAMQTCLDAPAMTILTREMQHARGCLRAMMWIRRQVN
jgi:colanic acid/amylovoran biosynthesis glycosyltransferase